jgi:hypothetical protein
MQNSKTHFEQVPVETVLKIATVDISGMTEVSRSAEQGTKEVSDASLARRKGTAMVARFDIFEIENDGSVRWIAVAASFDEAEATAQELAAHAGNGVIILDQVTGRKLIIDPTRRVSGSKQVERPC